MASPKRFLMAFLTFVAVAAGGVIFTAPDSASAAGVCGIGRTWEEEESGYHAVWHRDGDTDIFIADYTAPDGSRQSTSNKVWLNNSTVSIARLGSSDLRQCHYVGTLFGSTIDGTYNCGWATPRPWHASVECNAVPTGTPDIAGEWFREGDRARPAFVQDLGGGRLTFTNEFKNVSQGHFLDSQTVVAEQWPGSSDGLHGTVSADGTEIRWDNHTTWQR